MAEGLAPGLTADWLNAWLAAIGVTVLVPEVVCPGSGREHRRPGSRTPTTPTTCPA